MDSVRKDIDDLQASVEKDVADSKTRLDELQEELDELEMDLSSASQADYFQIMPEKIEVQKKAHAAENVHKSHTSKLDRIKHLVAFCDDGESNKDDIDFSKWQKIFDDDEYYSQFASSEVAASTSSSNTASSSNGTDESDEVPPIPQEKEEDIHMDEQESKAISEQQSETTVEHSEISDSTPTPRAKPLIDDTALKLADKSIDEVYQFFCNQYKCKVNSQMSQHLQKLGKDYDKIDVLDFNKNYIGNVGLSPVLEIIQRSTKLTLVKLSDNGLRNDGVKLLASVIERHPTLAGLDVSRNWISLGAAKVLIIAVTNNKNLVHIDVSKTKIPKTLQKKLKNLCNANKI